MKIYRIKNWKGHFEKAQLRACAKAAWIPVPNRYDGKSYGRLMRMADGPALYGAWVTIAGVASTCPTRGTLVDTDGPLTAEDIAIKTRMPQELVERALEVFSSEAIRWLEYSEDGGTTWLPADYQPTASPPSADHQAADGTLSLQDKTRQVGQDRTRQDKGAADSLVEPKPHESSNGQQQPAAPKSVALIVPEVCEQVLTVLSDAGLASEEAGGERLARAVDGMLRDYRDKKRSDMAEVRRAGMHFVEVVRECVKSKADNPVGAAKGPWYDWAGLPRPKGKAPAAQKAVAV